MPEDDDFREPFTPVSPPEPGYPDSCLEFAEDWTEKGLTVNWIFPA